MKPHWNLTTAMALAAVVMTTGCPKPPEQPAPTPAPTNSVVKKVAPPPRVTVPTTPTTSPTPAPESSQTVPMPDFAPKNNDPAQTIADIEASYHSLPDIATKTEAIFKISDAGGAPAVEALGRLFQAEKEPELRVEIVDSLFDIDGQDQLKIVILTAAVGADQTQEVREAAIEALTDVDAKVALPVLKALTTDPNEEIRDAAKDAIELLDVTGPTS